MPFEDEDKKRFKIDASNRRQAELAKEKLSDFKSTWKGVLEISCQSDRILYSKGRTNERRVQF
jgi:hypothetical protein